MAVHAGRGCAVRRWVWASAAVAPLALIGGWSWAAAVQPADYDPVRDTISALAAHGARHPAIMTVGLAVLGVCHLVTAAGLVEAGRTARVVLAGGGLATIGVAVLAQPSAGHVPAATLGFAALAGWPWTSRLPTRLAGRCATAALLCLLAGLAASLATGRVIGLSERLVAGAQALWPLVAVLLLHRNHSGTATPTPPSGWSAERPDGTLPR